ncbi:ribonuclease H-like domain-containing protein [Paraclostridium sordellii]|uniref:ribonuclease H-like domain-containing protein n=1 Tax=Paraclostridium sordellii TaxID=1505 RepID=UPI0005E6EF11|nr:ribonuclease H-like domain-containing protein [Paeniclostridium sordellii]CEO28154.1 exonuclease-like protein [[Clostridium] sordellii] [Paeniclostridium sordellii]
MQVITKTLDHLVDIPKDHYVFDIETTGLSPKFCKVILIGILYNFEDKTFIKQFFAESEDEERDLLLAFKFDIQNFKRHITFNGISFDIPFLNYRLKKNNIDFIINKSEDIDILRVVKPHKDKLSLSDCKLKTIERYLGIERADTISGKESVQLYKDFTLSRDESIKNKILLHNFEDIVNLGKIFKINEVLRDKLDFLNLSINSMTYDILLKKYKISKSILSLKFLSNNKFDPAVNIFTENYTITSEDFDLNVDINIKNAFDNHGNSISFYKLGSIIPLKINTNYIEKNILALSEYIFSKEF